MARVFSVLVLLSALLWLWVVTQIIIGYTSYQRFFAGLTGEGPSLSAAINYVRHTEIRFFRPMLPAWLALLIPLILPVLWLIRTARSLPRQSRYCRAGA